MIRFKALSGDKVDVPINENGDGVEARTNQVMMECALDRQTFLLNITKGQMLLVLQDGHEQDTCNMYPFVSGEFTPVESYSKRE